MQGIAVGRVFLQRWFALYQQKTCFCRFRLPPIMPKSVAWEGNHGLETEMTLLIGQVSEVCRAVVGVAKRRHVADRRGAGAQ
jgi:hypothetical protein